MGPAPEGNDRRPTGHRLDDAEPERFVEVDQVQQCVGATQHLRSFGRRRTGPRDRTRPSARWGSTSARKYSSSWMIPAMSSRIPRSVRHLDGVRGAFVGDGSARRTADGHPAAEWTPKRGCVDAVVDGRRIVQARVTVGVAYRDVVVGGVVPLVTGRIRDEEKPWRS